MFVGKGALLMNNPIERILILMNKKSKTGIERSVEVCETDRFVERHAVLISLLIKKKKKVLNKSLCLKRRLGTYFVRVVDDDEFMIGFPLLNAPRMSPKKSRKAVLLIVTRKKLGFCCLELVNPSLCCRIG